jgi:hypothetical protein
MSPLILVALCRRDTLVSIPLGGIGTIPAILSLSYTLLFSLYSADGGLYVFPRLQTRLDCKYHLSSRLRVTSLPRFDFYFIYNLDLSGLLLISGQKPAYASSEALMKIVFCNYTNPNLSYLRNCALKPDLLLNSYPSYWQQIHWA